MTVGMNAMQLAALNGLARERDALHADLALADHSSLSVTLYVPSPEAREDNAFVAEQWTISVAGTCRPQAVPASSLVAA